LDGNRTRELPAELCKGRGGPAESMVPSGHRLLFCAVVPETTRSTHRVFRMDSISVLFKRWTLRCDTCRMEWLIISLKYRTVGILEDLNLQDSSWLTCTNSLRGSTGRILSSGTAVFCRASQKKESMLLLRVESSTLPRI